MKPSVFSSHPKGRTPEKISHLDHNPSDNSRRDSSIDALRLVCAFMVIVIHFGSDQFNGICRLGVAVFFLITGLYLSEICRRNLIKVQVKKLLKYAIIASAIYMTEDFLLNHIDPAIVFTPRRIASLLVFNGPLFSAHLWFLFAMIYAIPLSAYIVQKTPSTKAVISIVIILDIVGLLISNPALSNVVNRNFLFYATPYILTGYLITRHWAAINNLSNYRLLAALALSVGLLIAEINITGHHSDNFYFLLPTAALIIVATKRIKPNKALDMIGRWGARYALWIYIFHATIGIHIYRHLHGIGPLGLTVSTFVVSWLCAVIWVALMRRLGQARKSLSSALSWRYSTRKPS